MEKSNNTRKHLINLGIILLISIVTTFLFAGGNNSLAVIGLNILYGLLIGLSIAMGSHLISRFFFESKRFENSPVKSFTLIVISIALFILIDVIVVNLIWFGVTQGKSVSEFFSTSFIRTILTLEFVMGLTIYFIILASKFSRYLKNHFKEISDIKQELSKYQYETLKSQMNPHFMFNTLNTLSGLIYEDVEKSDIFINHFANIYRYVLDVQHEDVVPISKELEFIENFLFLNNIRFNNAIKATVNIKNKEQYIVPLALQIIFENAIKHNKFNEKQHLEIDVTEENNCIKISNKKSPKLNVEPSTELGLNNIEKRYSTLSDNPVRIEDSESLFTVYLPILTNHK